MPDPLSGQPPPQSTEEEPTGPTLRELVGQVFYNPDTGFSGVLRFRVDRRTGQPVYWLSSPDGRAEQIFSGSRLITPDDQLVGIRSIADGDLTLVSGGAAAPSVQGVVGERPLTQSERDTLYGGLGGGGGAAAAAAATPWASTREAAELEHQWQVAADEAQRAWQEGRDADARAWEAEQTRLQNLWEEGQNRLDRELSRDLEETRQQNARRLQMMSDLTSLSQTAATIRQREREALAQLKQQAWNILGVTMGKDAMRGAALSTGMTPRGVSPMEAYRTDVQQVGEQAGQLRQALAEPLPTVNLGAEIPGLEAQISQFQELAQGVEMPEMPGAPVLGMAQGGVIGQPTKLLMANGRPVGQVGGVGFSVLVGEKGGFTGDEEVLNFDASGRLEDVRPLAGGAQEGVELPYDAASVQQALAPLYAGLGLSPQPSTTTQTTPGGTTAFAGGLPTLRTLGYQPDLMEAPSGTVYFREGDTWRPVSEEGFAANKWNWQDVYRLTPEEAAVIENPETMGQLITEALPLAQPGERRPRFPTRTVPLIAPFSVNPKLRSAGYVLPDPMMLAGGAWSGLSEATRRVIESALDIAGMSPSAAARRRMAFTPRGTARRRAGAVLG